MIWGSYTGLFNLTSYSGLPTDSTITSLDKSAVFPSISDTTTCIASSVPSPSYDTFSLASSPSSPPSEKYLLDSSPPPLPLTHFPGLQPFLLILWRLSNGLYQTACILVLLVSLPSRLCSLGSNQHRVVFIFLLWWWCFWSIYFGATASLGRDHFFSVAQI